MSNSEIALVVENTEEKAAARNRDSNSEATVEISSMKIEDGPPKEESHDPQESFLQKWKKIFLASCLFALLLDPLFLYVPMLKDDVKCLQSDRNLEIAALLLRSFTDLFYIFDIIFQIYRSDYFAGLMNEYHIFCLEHSNYSKIKFCWKYVVPTIAKTIWGPYHILIDILAILPLPQVAILIFFSEMRDLRSLNTIRMVIMNLFVLLQYVPRILRIYLSCKELKRTPKKETGETTKWVKGVLNFFMYIIASHIFGAIWYFLAIQRMATCWHDACRKANGCNTSNFGCHDHHTFRNITFLNDLCPISLVNTTLFDFGIYIAILQSGIPGSTNYFVKFSKCFWWGLQNLSSFGSNLEPSINGWETLFAACTSIIGLLLFLYLIGNLQAYMQFDTTRIEAHRHKMKVKRKMKEKGQEIELWLFGIPEWLKKDIKPLIMDKVRQELEEDRDADLNFILSTFPSENQIQIKSAMPITRLKRVPIFQNMDESVLEAICLYLEPKKYTKNDIITKEGEPMMLLLIVDGFVDIEERDDSINLQRVSGEVYGEELLVWPLSNSFPDVVPLATVSAVGDVKAYTLTASDLKSVVFECRIQYFFGMIACEKFTAKEVDKATQNYHASRIIRRQQSITSGRLSASVYKGELPDKTAVEVERYTVNSSDVDFSTFVKLVAVASRTNHINLVRLLGWCLEGRTIALVSEYIPNACTLFQRIYGKEGKASSPLSLELRMKIASETAGALAYLRSLTTTPILPSFVSTSSILLDDNCTAKLRSFGLRFVPNDSRDSLSSIRQGCFDPESKTLIEKLDVYGIGVVLAELLTSPNAISSIGKRDLEKLKILFQILVEEDRLNEILDGKIIVKEGDFETAKKVAHLATRCLRYEKEEMPSMKGCIFAHHLNPRCTLTTPPKS
ncbi:PREDICTED: cyclic nucleotide-gated ion channel 1-like [Prunus mume]|uniref:Cyclic nucleotide-gated ion channel 1-like n=1 Tax=Prunus mume TaxID=102107 RepID=A0ABM0P2L9_PRUMU|nr:PREDICTED: cyclic nucleotide-gated ion channel 1-like [Prunus mume]